MKTFSLPPRPSMHHLLVQDTFDSFFFLEGDIHTFNRFHIDGHLCSDFFDETPSDAYSQWKEVRSYCFQVIRGNRPPLQFRIILGAPDSIVHDFLTSREWNFPTSQIQGLYLNFLYKDKTLICTTGCSTKTFLPDKQLEREWDLFVQEYFRKIPLDVVPF